MANATLTKAKTDLSLGTVAPNVTTNEFTTLGLSRAAGALGAYTTPGALGAYTTPGALGGQFTRRVTKLFTATGNATAIGGGLFDNGATVSPSNMYVEDNFASSAVLVLNDTLTVNVDISN